MISVRARIQRRPALKQIKRAVPSGSVVPRWWLSHGATIHARIDIGAAAAAQRPTIWESEYCFTAW
jgi:hypothetical protein